MPAMRAARRVAAALAGVLALGLTAGAPDVAVVEDWAGQPAGTTGIPLSWESRSLGRPARYDLSVVAEGGRNVLHLVSDDEHTVIGKPLHVNLKDTPILEWSWKVVALPTGADLRRKETSDSAVALFVAWRRVPEFLRSRLIGYAWDTATQGPPVFGSPKTRTVTYVVVRSGAADLGRWITERRDVWADYRAIYGSDPETPSLLSISIDTNDTRSHAESFIGPILFRRRAVSTAPSSPAAAASGPSRAPQLRRRPTRAAPSGRRGGGRRSAAPPAARRS
jgi:hypothetical protein